MANEEQETRHRIFYYRGVNDPATKWGYMAANIVVVVGGLYFVSVIVRHLLGIL